MAHHLDDEDPREVLASFLIASASASQAAKHVVARAALLELILRDPRWCDTFATWALDLGIVPAARDLREAPDPAAATSAEQRLGRVFHGLAQSGALEERVTIFVEETLRLSVFAWLAEDLHLGFQQEVLAYAYREDRETVFELRAPAPPAPRIRIPAFRDRPGETDGETRARLREFRLEVERIERMLDAAPATDGNRMPKNHGEYIGRYVSWFYRAHTKAARVSALAKEHHRHRHQEVFERDGDCRCRRADDVRWVAPDDRPAIYAGIRVARELLELDVLSIEEPDPTP